jgi:NAD(P) transhydrogenase
MEELSTDLIVIGSGPAGQKAAIQAAKLGEKVVVIEKDHVPGGNCLNSGTIPSKSLREAIIDLSDFHQRSFYGKDYCERIVSINDLNYRLKRVLEEERFMILRQFSKNHIQLIHGNAQLENRYQVRVHDEHGKPLYLVSGKVIMIATGSTPRNPTHVPFDDQVILDSTRLLSIDKVPHSMLVLGGGIIGSEYASFFAALGAEVIVVDKRDHILPALDSEIGHHLQMALTGIGLKFIGNKEIESIEKIDQKGVVKFKDGTQLEADVILYALGRVADVDSLQIKNVGIELNKNGFIPVNALFQTVVPNIYAVGDVIGPPSLASTSMEQGRLAARHAFGATTHHFPHFYPIGIYTIPEISSCGYTEEELKKLGFRYEVGRAYYYEIARSHISGSQPGLFKIIFHSETLEILGIHIIGRNATEVIHIGQVAMTFNAHIDYFIEQVFNYPTYAEGYRIAALNGMNKVKYLK